MTLYIASLLQSLPIARHLPTFMNECFGIGNWVFCEDKNLYIARRPEYKGPGIGFYAIRPNRTWFTGERKDIEDIRQWKTKPWEAPVYLMHVNKGGAQNTGPRGEI